MYEENVNKEPTDLVESFGKVDFENEVFLF